MWQGDGENYTLRSFVIVLLIKFDRIGGDCSRVGMWEICGNLGGGKMDGREHLERLRIGRRMRSKCCEGNKVLGSESE